MEPIIGKKKRAGRALLVGMVLLCLAVAACTDRRPATADAPTAAADSLQQDSLVADTVADIVEDAPLPKAVDELFDDFFFNFAGNRHTQMNRIVFPLPVHKEDGTARLERRQWQYSHFFMAEGYYVLLFDNPQQDSLSKLSNLDHASVEKLYLNQNLMKLYDFNRIDGEWRLTSIAHSRLSEHPCAPFLHFYEQFAADTAFQAQSLDDFVVMTAPDSDDDFTEITGSIMPEQWPTFKPDIIPEGVIYLVNYGQHYADSSQKVVIVRGVANGLNIEMTFRRKNNGWKLVKFST